MRLRQLKPISRPLDAVFTIALMGVLIVGGYALGLGLEGVFVTIVIAGEVLVHEVRTYLKRDRRKVEVPPGTSS
jgi:uncharacterized membrane protein